MLKITVIAVGKLKERFWREACAEYEKRLSSYCKLTVRELPDSNLEQEAILIEDALKTLGNNDTIIVLDIAGRPTSSEGLAQLIADQTINGVSHIVFVIGGSDGIAPRVKAQATQRLSFGPITLPHNLARVVLLEQVYRAFKIDRGEPYHK